MDKQLEREYVTTMVPIYAIWATLGGEATKTYGEETTKTLEKLLKLTFPYLDVKDSAKRQAADMKLMDQIFKVFEVPQQGPPKTEPEGPKKQGIFNRIKSSFKGGKT